MKRLIAATAVAAAFAQPASAITFSKLTTIYVAGGVTDTGAVATSFLCTNLSGQIATLRIAILHPFTGNVIDSFTGSFSHGTASAISTRETAIFSTEESMASGIVTQGAVNIESTQSGVFCNAMIVDAAANVPNGIALDLVRVNPHPGTVE